jgi:transcriptional regulator with XRE-family HTH domain
MRLTQAQVAGQLGIETVSRLETGVISPTLERLDQLSRLFNCPVSAFFSYETKDARADPEPDDYAVQLARIIRPLNNNEKKVFVNFIVQTVGLYLANRI